MIKVETDPVNQLEIYRDKPYLAEVRDIVEYYPKAEPLLKELEYFDCYTFQHSLLAEYFSRKLADGLGFSEEDRGVFRLAALLHDFGKTAIDKKVINSYPFSESDLEKMKPHVVAGFKKIIEICPDAAEIMLRHHSFQRYFYPSDEEISIVSKLNDPVKLAKIEKMANYLAIVDNFEVHSGERPNKKPETLEKFLPILKKQFKSADDMEAIEVLVRALGNK
jgi:HD-GYP domain-containing protein (c-di-GMP phosphodiesterase class II)